MNKFTYQEYKKFNEKYFQKLTLWDVLTSAFDFVSAFLLFSVFSAFSPDILSVYSKGIIVGAAIIILVFSYTTAQLSSYFRYRYINELIELKGKNTNETENTCSTQA